MSMAYCEELIYNKRRRRRRRNKLHLLPHALRLEDTFLEGKIDAGTCSIDVIWWVAILSPLKPIAESLELRLAQLSLGWLLCVLLNWPESLSQNRWTGQVLLLDRNDDSSLSSIIIIITSMCYWSLFTQLIKVINFCQWCCWWWWGCCCCR